MAETFSITREPMCLMNFDSVSILTYSAKASTHTGCTDTKVIEINKKGLCMFKEHFVCNIQFVVSPGVKPNEEIFTIYGDVKAEMKKNTKYRVKAEISSSTEILSCSCGCPAGLNPAFCKHSFALLYAIQDYSTKEMYAAPTEKLQTWHQPRPTKFSPKKSSEIFSRKKSDLDSKTAKVSDLVLDWSALNNCNPIFNVLANEGEIRYKNSVPLPLVAYAGPPYRNMPETLTMHEILLLHTTLVFDVESIMLLEHQTIGQNNSAWKSARKVRLTASDFGRVLRRKNNFDELACQILKQKEESLLHIPAVKHGIEYEGYVRNIVRCRFPECTVRETGFVTHPSYPFLGASPDGLISSFEQGPMLLEIKCVYNPEGLDLDSLIEKRSNFCLEKTTNGFRLKRTHIYYAQIQGQLALSNIGTCFFALMHKTGKNDIFYETIDFDQELWDKSCCTLTSFYFKHYLKALQEEC